MNDHPPSSSQETHLQSLDDELWTLSFPLRFFGLQLGRRVCVIRLADNRLVIHSTGPFTENHIRQLSALGTVSLLLDATTMHDTFSSQAQVVFPDLPYLVPEGFPPKAAGANARPLRELASLTGGALQTVRLKGMRLLNEYACFHPASRTLILCDLLFNLVDATGWTRWSMKNLMGVDQWPAIDRPVRMAVKNKANFSDSLRRILAWDFDRIVVAHGNIIETDGKPILNEALHRAGFDLGR